MHRRYSSVTQEIGSARNRGCLARRAASQAIAIDYLPALTGSSETLTGSSETLTGDAELL
jgi:hypothetical protein